MSQPQTSNIMIATLVYIQVKAGFIQEFMEASRINHENSIKEEGNLRFDIIQNDEDPTSFVFYEVYEDEEAIARHKETAHYLHWRDRVGPWMAVPRKGIRHRTVLPKDRNLW